MSEPSTSQKRLTMLRYEFDKAILHGKSFEEVKMIYLQIKEIEADIFSSTGSALPGAITPPPQKDQ